MHHSILLAKLDKQIWMSFFAYKNHAYPEYGKLRKTDKSEFLHRYQEIQEPSYEKPGNIEVIVIDGTTFVHMNPPKQSRTFGDY